MQLELALVFLLDEPELFIESDELLQVQSISRIPVGLGDTPQIYIILISPLTDHLENGGCVTLTSADGI